MSSTNPPVAPPTSFTNFIQRRHILREKLEIYISKWSIPSLELDVTLPIEITNPGTDQKYSDSKHPNLALLKRGMSPKKLHEVSNFTHFIHERCENVLRKAENFVIDIGSGLGYLDQFLWYLHSYRVIGVESNLHHIKRAEKRNNLINTTCDKTRYDYTVNSTS